MPQRLPAKSQWLPALDPRYIPSTFATDFVTMTFVFEVLFAEFGHDLSSKDVHDGGVGDVADD